MLSSLRVPDDERKARRLGDETKGRIADLASGWTVDGEAAPASGPSEARAPEAPVAARDAPRQKPKAPPPPPPVRPRSGQVSPVGQAENRGTTTKHEQSSARPTSAASGPVEDSDRPIFDRAAIAAGPRRERAARVAPSDSSASFGVRPAGTGQSSAIRGTPQPVTRGGTAAVLDDSAVSALEDSAVSALEDRLLSALDDSGAAALGNRQPAAETGNRLPAAETGNRQPAAALGNRQPAAATGNRQPAAAPNRLAATLPSRLAAARPSRVTATPPDRLTAARRDNSAADSSASELDDSAARADQSAGRRDSSASELDDSAARADQSAGRRDSSASGLDDSSVSALDDSSASAFGDSSASALDDGSGARPGDHPTSEGYDSSGAAFNHASRPALYDPVGFKFDRASAAVLHDRSGPTLNHAARSALLDQSAFNNASGLTTGQFDRMDPTTSDDRAEATTASPPPPNRAAVALREPAALRRKRGLAGDLRYVATVYVGLRRARRELGRLEAQQATRQQSRRHHLVTLGRTAVSSVGFAHPALAAAQTQLTGVEDQRAQHVGDALSADAELTQVRGDRATRATQYLAELASLDAELVELARQREPLAKQAAGIGHRGADLRDALHDIDARIRRTVASLDSAKATQADRAAIQAELATMKADRKAFQDDAPELARMLDALSPQIAAIDAARSEAQRKRAELVAAEHADQGRAQELLAAIGARRKVVDRAAGEADARRDEILFELGGDLYIDRPEDLTGQLAPIDDIDIELGIADRRIMELREILASVDRRKLARGIALLGVLLVAIGAIAACLLYLTL